MRSSHSRNAQVSVSVLAAVTPSSGSILQLKTLTNGINGSASLASAGVRASGAGRSGGNPSGAGPSQHSNSSACCRCRLCYG